MSRHELAGVTVEALRGDIADQPDVDAIVNAANAELMPGGGVAGAIHRAAGPDLAAESGALAPISPGEAVITGAHDLPNRTVIHCLGPVYGRDEPAAELLASCYVNALRLAEEAGVRSIAFPAISAGAFGYPIDEAARVVVDTVLAAVPQLDSVRHIRLVLYSDSDLAVFEHVLEERL